MAKLSAAAAINQMNSGNAVGVVRVPQGIDLFRVKKAGMVRMAIVPYIIPQDAKGLPDGVSVGDMYYQRTFFTHGNFGPQGKSYEICPKMTFGERCPICEARSELFASGSVEDKELAKKLKPKQRTLFNIYLPDENKVVLFETSFHTFTEMLYKSIQTKLQIPGYDWVQYFPDPEDGAWIYANFEEKALPGSKFYEATTFEFQPHKGLPKEVLAQAMPLDNLLNVESYQSLYAMYWDAPAPEPVAKATVGTASLSEPKKTEGVSKQEAPKQEAPASKEAKPAPAQSSMDSWIVKGAAAYHKTIGAGTIYKVNGDVVTFLDAEDNPSKVKISELSQTPFPSVPSPAEETVGAAVGEDSGDSDAPWDADWDK